MRKRRHRTYIYVTKQEARENVKFGCLVTLIVLCAAIVQFLAQTVIFLLCLMALPMPLFFAWQYRKKQKRYKFLRNLHDSCPWLIWLIALIIIGIEALIVKTNYTLEHYPFGSSTIWVDSLAYLGLYNLGCGIVFIRLTTW